MRIQYINKRFKDKSLQVIEKVNEIIDEYTGQGFDLTLRQLYYQLVSRALIPNAVEEYGKLGKVVNDGRLSGLIDWDAVVDRTREIRRNSHWNSPKEIVQACANQYEIDKWQNQEFRPEVWIEKDALIGVIEGICRELDVSHFSCRGYTSQSEMWRAARRIDGYLMNGQTPVILHFGDHDPSGIDMTRDIRDRLEMFRVPIEVRRIALTMDQVNQYSPPPNPAKVSDSRFQAYLLSYGSESWELDALDPSVLSQLVENEVRGFIDSIKWDEMVEKEEQEREQIRNLL